MSYNFFDAVVRLVLLKYKILNIPSMSYFIMAFDSWLGASAHEPSLKKELSKTK